MNIRRRDILAGAGALAVGTAARGEIAKQKIWGTAQSDTYFLSSRNPLATADQRHLDALALELLSRPDVRRAKRSAADAFARVTDQTVSKEVWAMFPAYVESYAFRSIQIAVNSDANHPRVYRVYTPAAKWLGNELPEARWGQENPDNIYRIIPIAGDGRYVLRGQRHANPAADVSYVLVADTNTSITLGLLGQRDLEVSADGSFEITLDETPANGRRNHIQTTSEALYLFIRDSLNDWRQTPNALTVERLNPPSRGQLDADELAARAARVMQIGVAPAYYWNQLVLNRPGQTMSQPHGTGASGGLLTQQSSHGWFDLGDGEAAMITFTPMDAAYQSIVLYDRWGRTLDYRDHQTSLNGTQMVPDTDGNFRIVIAPSDPGIHNWLDTMGLHELCVGIRWQGIAAGVADPPQLSVDVLNEADLARSLLERSQRITSDQRAAQIHKRQTDHDRRYIES